MSTRPAILALMGETVTIAPFLSRTAYGAATYGPAVPSVARIEYTAKEIRTADGRDVISRGTVYVPDTTLVGIEDQVTLANGDVVLPLDVRPVADISGALHHTEVAF